MRAKAYIVHRAMCEPELEWRKPKDCLSAEPLYAKREWQGLTDEEHKNALNVCSKVGVEGLVFWIEDKLRERNT